MEAREPEQAPRVADTHRPGTAAGADTADRHRRFSRPYRNRRPSYSDPCPRPHNPILAPGRKNSPAGTPRRSRNRDDTCCTDNKIYSNSPVSSNRRQQESRLVLDTSDIGSQLHDTYPFFFAVDCTPAHVVRAFCSPPSDGRRSLWQHLERSWLQDGCMIPQHQSSSSTNFRPPSRHNFRGLFSKLWNYRFKNKLYSQHTRTTQHQLSEQQLPPTPRPRRHLGNRILEPGVQLLAA